MEEQPEASFEATYGPVAKEVSFEYDHFLKTLGNGYRCDLTAWPWRARFRPLAAGGSTRCEVRAAAGWQPSGVRVERGQAYVVTAEGRWRTAAAGGDVDAAGDASGRGLLTAAIFSEFVLGEPIPLGAEKRFVAATDGQLMLRCADDWTQLGDNDGELKVAVRRAE